MKRINKQTINIGIVCSPWLGGSGVVGSELARYLAKDSKYKVVFIGDDFPFRLGKSDVVFHKIESLNHALFTHPLSEAALTEGIVKAVLKYKLQIIHAHFAIPFAHCAIQAKEILRKMGINVRVITTLHGTDVLNLGREVPKTMQHILEESDVVTSVSMSLAIKVKKLYKVKRPVQVIYNFVDLKQFTNPKVNPVLKEKFAKPDQKVFVHISNFRPIKRIRETLRVFFKTQKSLPSVLIMIGEGPDISTIQKLPKVVRDSKSIHFIGRVKNPYKYLQIADGLILTSKYESFSLAGLEAIASGVPVFGTNVGGIPEVIEHEKSGYLTKLGDVNSMSRHMLTHFSDQKRVVKMKKKAKEASKSFSAKKIIPQYESIYRSLALSLAPSNSFERKTTIKSAYNL